MPGLAYVPDQVGGGAPSRLIQKCSPGHLEWREEARPRLHCDPPCGFLDYWPTGPTLPAMAGGVDPVGSLGRPNPHPCKHSDAVYCLGQLTHEELCPIEVQVPAGLRLASSAPASPGIPTGIWRSRSYPRNCDHIILYSFKHY